MPSCAANTKHTCRELGEGRPLTAIAGLTGAAKKPPPRSSAHPPQPRSPVRGKPRPHPLPARHLANNACMRAPTRANCNHPGHQPRLARPRIYCLANPGLGHRKHVYGPWPTSSPKSANASTRHRIRNFLFRSDLVHPEQKMGHRPVPGDPGRGPRHRVGPATAASIRSPTRHLPG